MAKQDLTPAQQERANELVNQTVPADEAERIAQAQIDEAPAKAAKAAKGGRYVVQHNGVGAFQKGEIVTSDDFADMQRLLDLGAVVPEGKVDADKDAK